MKPSNQAFKKYGFWFGLVIFLSLIFSNTQTSITSEDRIEAKMELRKAKARLEALE